MISWWKAEFCTKCLRDRSRIDMVLWQINEIKLNSLHYQKAHTGHSGVVYCSLHGQGSHIKQYKWNIKDLMSGQQSGFNFQTKTFTILLINRVFRTERQLMSLFVFLHLFLLDILVHVTYCLRSGSIYVYKLVWVR